MAGRGPGLSRPGGTIEVWAQWQHRRDIHFYNTGIAPLVADGPWAIGRGVNGGPARDRWLTGGGLDATSQGLRQEHRAARRSGGPARVEH